MDSRKEIENWNIYVNRKRTFGSYLYLLKVFAVRFIKAIPYRLTARFRKLPDFLVIGVAKGGTSSLYAYLNQHPDMHLSREQEIHFFAKYYNRGLNFYRSFFPFKSSKKITGESSPYYFFHPQVPKRVKKDLPNAKIILLLRDPVHRAYSNYNMVKGVDWVDSFDEAVEVEKLRITPHHEKMKVDPNYRNQQHQTFSYLSRGFYYEQLQNWLKHYTLDEMLILKSEDFFENPKQTLTKVYKYLGARELFPEDLSAKNARTYSKLPPEKYQELKEFYSEDSETLANLLGNKFRW